MVETPPRKAPWWRRRSKRFYAVTAFGLLALFGAVNDDAPSDEEPNAIVADDRIEEAQAEPTTSTTTTTREPTTTSAQTTSRPAATPAGARGIFVRAVSASELNVALEALDSGEVLPELVAPVPYRRDEYQDGWGDADGDCFSDRHEILLERSEAPTTQVDCNVATGQWTDPYDGTVYTDARLVTIDHFVPLSAAHRAGAWAWDVDTKEAFAGDISYRQSHVPTGQTTNEQKGDSEPHLWRPNEDAWCGYAIDWVAVKTRWALAYSVAEVAAIREMLDTCAPINTVAPATTVPRANPQASTTTTTEAIVASDGAARIEIAWCDRFAEAVEIVNLGGEIDTLQGWVLHDEKRNWETTLDRVSLSPGQSVIMLSGEDTLDTEGTLRWADRSVWNNDGDTATLRRPNGTIVSEVRCR